MICSAPAALLRHAGARQRAAHRPGARRRRPRAARRRGRSCDPHAPRSRAGTAIGRIPGDAGLPMDVDWQLPKGFAAGPLRYPVPTRLTVAGLMNYVFERDYAVLVRLKVPAECSGHGADPRRRALARLHRQDLRARAGRACARSPGRQRHAEPRCNSTHWRQQLAAAARRRSAISRSPATSCASRSRCRRASPSRDPYLFPITDNAVDYEAPQSFRRAGDWLVAELQTKERAGAIRRGARARATGEGCEFHAVPGAVPAAERRSAGFGWQAVLMRGARRDRRRHSAEPDALRVPDPGAEGAALSRRPARARAQARTRRARLRRRRGRRHRRAWHALLLAIRAAGAEAGWAFQLQDPRTIMLLLLLAVAITANLLGLFELPVLGGGCAACGKLRRPERSPPSSRRPAPARSSAQRSALRCCCRQRPRSRSSLRSGSASRLPFLVFAFVPQLQATSCRSRAGGWIG